MFVVRKPIASVADSSNCIQRGHTGTRGRASWPRPVANRNKAGNERINSGLFDHLGAERGCTLLGHVSHKDAGMQSVEHVERFVPCLDDEHSLRLIRLLLVTLSSQNRPNST